eukprot:4597869-Heterocapsa_arctica.AAC.1
MSLSSTTGLSERPLAIAIRCATKRLSLFTHVEPRRSNGSQQNINSVNGSQQNVNGSLTDH